MQASLSKSYSACQFTALMKFSQHSFHAELRKIYIKGTGQQKLYKVTYLFEWLECLSVLWLRCCFLFFSVWWVNVLTEVGWVNKSRCALSTHELYVSLTLRELVREGKEDWQKVVKHKSWCKIFGKYDCVVCSLCEHHLK